MGALRDFFAPQAGRAAAGGGEAELRRIEARAAILQEGAQGVLGWIFVGGGQGSAY
jgi:hypothetical protein